MSAKSPSTIRRPPAMSGPVRWLADNLFSSWLNAVLTFVALAIFYLFFSNLIPWALTQARWEVIPANIKPLIIGNYPPDQVWRVWASLYIISLLLGFSSGMRTGLVRQVAAALAITSVLLIAVAGPATLAAAVALLSGHLLGLAAKGRRWSLHLERGLWLLSFPLVVVVLIGFGDEGWLFARVPAWQYWGLLVNLLGAVVGIALSLPIGILLALGRQSSLPAIRWVCTFYIEIVRGVPLISLLFIANNLLTLFIPGSFKPDIVIRAMVTITAFSAAYMAENVRGGLQAIPRGQVEAAYAIGLNPFLTIGLIILPQALRSVIPAIVGQFISLFKDTSLFSFIAILDILAFARSIFDGNIEWRGTHFELYIFAAVVFWVFCYSFSYISRQIEKRLGVGER